MLLQKYQLKRSTFLFDKLEKQIWNVDGICIKHFLWYKLIAEFIHVVTVYLLVAESSAGQLGTCHEVVTISSGQVTFKMLRRYLTYILVKVTRYL